MWKPIKNSFWREIVNRNQKMRSKYENANRKWKKSYADQVFATSGLTQLMRLCNLELSERRHWASCECWWMCENISCCFLNYFWRWLEVSRKYLLQLFAFASLLDVLDFVDWHFTRVSMGKLNWDKRLITGEMVLLTNNFCLGWFLIRESIFSWNTEWSFDEKKGRRN